MYIDGWSGVRQQKMSERERIVQAAQTQNFSFEAI